MRLPLRLSQQLLSRCRMIKLSLRQSVRQALQLLLRLQVPHCWLYNAQTNLEAAEAAIKHLYYEGEPHLPDIQGIGSSIVAGEQESERMQVALAL